MSDTQTILINDVEYNVADLSEQTISLINRVSTLRQRIAEAQNTITELDILVGVYSEQVIASLPDADAPAQEELDV